MDWAIYCITTLTENHEGNMYSMTRELIERGQILAKAQDEALRMAKTQLYIDYYKNIIKDVLEKYVDRVVSDPESREELKKYIESDYTCERLINQICLLFQNEPVIKTTLENETAQEQLEELIKYINLHPLLDTVEKYVALVRDVPVIPFINGNQLRFIPVMGNNAFVEQDENDPTQFTRFYYSVGVLEQTTVGNPINLFHFWQLDGEWWQKYECKVNESRKVIDEKLVEGAARYPKSLCPVTVFRDYYPIDNFWHDGNSSLVNKSINIDIKRTELAMGESYNTPEKVLTNADEGDTFKKGRVFMHKLNSKGLDDGQSKDLKYINPNEALEAAQKLILDRFEQMALKEGLSKNLISGESFTSGYHMMLGKQDIINRNRKKRKYFRPAMKQLLKVAQYAWKFHLKKPIFESPEFEIDFAEYEVISSKSELEQYYTVALTNNTLNLVDIELMKNPDLNNNREKAMEIVAERAKENKTIRETLYSNAGNLKTMLEE